MNLSLIQKVKTITHVHVYIRRFNIFETKPINETRMGFKDLRKRIRIYKNLLIKSVSSRPLALTRTTSRVPWGIFCFLIFFFFFKNSERKSEEDSDPNTEMWGAFVWLVGPLRKSVFFNSRDRFLHEQYGIYIWAFCCSAWARETYELCQLFFTFISFIRVIKNCFFFLFISIRFQIFGQT